MQQLTQKLEVSIKQKIAELGDYNPKQKDDMFRYFKEAYTKKGYDEDKSMAIANIRFNHKYSFNKQHKRYGLGRDYIKRKIDQVK